LQGTYYIKKNRSLTSLYERGWSRSKCW